MQREVTFAGFGGQGIMTAGKLLALAGMAEGKEVAWIPSYGPEMRGGTAYCTVVIADRLIGSPIVNDPENVFVFNRPSLDKFGPRVRPGGVLLINSSLINRDAQRDDVTVVKVPANEIANELSNSRGANMVALGAYLGATHAVSLAVVEGVVRETFAAKPKLVDVNLEALHRGYELGEQVAKKGEVR